MVRSSKHFDVVPLRPPTRMWWSRKVHLHRVLSTAGALTADVDDHDNLAASQGVGAVPFEPLGKLEVIPFRRALCHRAAVRCAGCSPCWLSGVLTERRSSMSGSGSSDVGAKAVFATVPPWPWTTMVWGQGQIDLPRWRWRLRDSSVVTSPPHVPQHEVSDSGNSNSMLHQAASA
jgi:hypothetical protein